jgi:RNA polymerase sigma-70 factor (ECF subfamily)
MDKQQEMELVRRAQTGAVPAFERLIAHYQSRLLRYLMLRGLQRADAEDAVQTAFINAWQYLHSYRSSWRFSTWLYRIAGRAAADINNKHKHIESLDEQHAVSLDSDPTWPDDNIWLLARLHLSAHLFDLLWLHYGEGFSGAEIARIKQRTQVWVRVNLMRARQQLQLKLNQH